MESRSGRKRRKDDGGQEYWSSHRNGSFRSPMLTISDGAIIKD